MKEYKNISKSLIFIFISISILIIMSSFFLLYLNINNNDNSYKNRISDEEVQRYFSEFDKVKLNANDDNLIDLSANKKLDSSVLSDDSVLDVNDVKYDININKENGNVKLTMSMKLNNKMVSDTMHGLLIEKDESYDTIFIVNGEAIYLSEINEVNESIVSKAANNIINELIKIAYTGEHLKLVVAAFAPAAILIGGLVELAIKPITIINDIVVSLSNKSIKEDFETKEVNGKHYIDSQDEYYKQWKLGFGNMYDNGCGVIATYNVLVFADIIKENLSENLKNKFNSIGQYRRYCLSKIIDNYVVNSQALVHGIFGINPSEFEPMISSYDINIVTYSNNDGQNKFIKACDDLQSNQMGILCYWWASDDFEEFGAHYVTFMKIDDEYVILNGDSFANLSNYLYEDDYHGFIEGWIVTK